MQHRSFICLFLAAICEGRYLHAEFPPEECIWPDPYGVTSIVPLPEEQEGAVWIDDRAILMEKWQHGMDLRGIIYCLDETSK